MSKPFPDVVKLNDKVQVQFVQDQELDALVAVLKVSELDRDELKKLSEHIMSCSGEEFSMSVLDGKPVLTRVLTIRLSELSQNIIQNMVYSLIEKLKNCEVTKKVQELLEEKRRKKTKTTRKSTSSKKKTS